MPRKKVMVVDEDIDVLEELREALFLSGYNPLAVSDSSTAFSIARMGKPDVILIDLKMNPANGSRIAEKLSQFPDTAHIPIIAMTSRFTDEKSSSPLDNNGIKAVLKKPFMPLDVITQIENVLSEIEDKTDG